MAPEQIERLQQVAGRTWLRTLGIVSALERGRAQGAHPGRRCSNGETARRPAIICSTAAAGRIPEDNRWGLRKSPQLLYNRGELYNLSVARGTLAEEDRYKINEHMIQTIIMLSALPFPEHLRKVPEIAGGHHEKMDGNGYPNRLKREDMSPVARMMAIADIFEALTAADRPYKKGKTLSESIKIMSLMKKDQHIDPELFDLFLARDLPPLRGKIPNPAQIDDVDISSYLSATKG